MGDGTDSKPPKPVQQDSSFTRKRHGYFSNGSDDRNEAIRNNLQALVVSMAALESEMSAFNVYVITQQMHDKPLNMWPKYEQYSGLAAASKELEDTVKRVKILVQSVSQHQATQSCVS
jgi:hypothetical protein